MLHTCQATVMTELWVGQTSHLAKQLDPNWEPLASEGGLKNDLSIATMNSWLQGIALDELPEQHVLDTNGGKQQS